MTNYKIHNSVPLKFLTHRVNYTLAKRLHYIKDYSTEPEHLLLHVCCIYCKIKLQTGGFYLVNSQLPNQVVMVVFEYSYFIFSEHHFLCVCTEHEISIKYIKVLLF